MYIAKIQKWGNSQGVRIPRHILEQSKLNTGDTVEVSVEDSRIIIYLPKRRLKNYTITELFESYEGNYKLEELDWGAPVGKEEW